MVLSIPIKHQYIFAGGEGVSNPSAGGAVGVFKA